MLRISLIFSGLAFLSLGLLAGCTHNTSKPVASTEPPRTTEHAHKPGAHGGIVVSIGRDNYHAEPVFEKNGKVRLYMLGQDESRVQEVELQEPTAFVRAEGDNNSIEIAFKPAPQKGDSPGKTSLFVTQLPGELIGKKVEVVIPILKIGEERFRVGFNSTPTQEDHMPAGASAEQEKILYLTPKGKYTEKDIEANGRMVASQKYRGFKARHDLKPKPGDRICPVTLTKANPQCTWIVDGQSYQFCCPPCIDEFVATARNQPELIKAAIQYVKK